MKNKNFDRDKQYCFKKDGNAFFDTLTHAWGCGEDFDIEAWESIDDAFLFDIKLYTDISYDTYKEVIDKIKEISQNKFIWLHCSNTAEEILNKKMYSLYWEIINDFYTDVDFGIEFEHKLQPKEPLQFHTDFFNDIKNFSIDNNLSWAKIYMLDKDITTQHMYYHRNEEIILDKSHESCILE